MVGFTCKCTVFCSRDWHNYDVVVCYFLLCMYCRLKLHYPLLLSIRQQVIAYLFWYNALRVVSTVSC